MKRHGYVQSTPIKLPPLPTPEPGSLDAQLADARRLILSESWKPHVKEAALAGAEAETGHEDCPYPPGSVEAAAWLLGWWRRDQDERHL
jgi:hypothetical protein